jgi:hypothetical protein
MRSVVINLMPLARGTCVVTLMLIPLAGSAGPAQAQDLLGFTLMLIPLAGSAGPAQAQDLLGFTLMLIPWQVAQDPHKPRTF